LKIVRTRRATSRSRRPDPDCKIRTRRDGGRPSST